MGFGASSLRSPARPPAWSSRRLLRFELFDDRLQRFNHLVAIDAGLGEAQLQVEQLGGGFVLERVMLRTPGLGLRCFLADRLPRYPAVPAHPLADCDHFLGV